MKTGETQRYSLTFRCINCGKYEAFVDYPSDGVLEEDQIRGRIYEVTCNSCGWRGSACGLSAISVSCTATSKSSAAAGHAN